MKIAVLSDIHGNDFALTEVLNSALRQGVEKLLILGDFVGYYYNPEKVFALLESWDYSFIKGNHENILSDLLNKRQDEEQIKKKYGSGHRIAIDKLSEDRLFSLISAPELKTEIVDGLTFKMCHGSPWDANEYIYPDSDRNVFEKCDDENSDFVLIGHSHYSFIHCNKNSVLINPGSVGQSKNRGGVANWTIINTTNRSIECNATPYNTSDLEQEVERHNPDILFLKSVLKRNH